MPAVWDRKRNVPRNTSRSKPDNVPITAGACWDMNGFTAFLPDCRGNFGRKPVQRISGANAVLPLGCGPELRCEHRCSLAPVGVITAPRIQPANGLFRTSKKPTSMPTVRHSYLEGTPPQRFHPGRVGRRPAWNSRAKLDLLKTDTPVISPFS